MSDNKTTELLREGLTERGIEWRSGLEGVTFVGDWCLVEYDNGRLAATCEPVLTPEQAIAATLGSGTLTAEQVSKAVYAHSIHADCADADWQAIADELSARAERTCRIDSTLLIEGEYVPSPYYEYEMECGGGFCWNDSEPPTYCPNCGRRVVE